MKSEKYKNLSYPENFYKKLKKGDVFKLNNNHFYLRKKTKSELKEIKNRYETILNNVNSGILVLDKVDFSILELNKETEKLLGIKKKYLIGKNCSIIFPKDERKKYLKKIKTNIKKQKKFTLKDILIFNIQKKKNIEIDMNVKICNVCEKKVLITILNRKEQQKIIAEQNKINKLRADIWKLAFNKNLSEEKLIYELLKKFGQFFDVSRVSFNLKEKQGFRCVIEWQNINVSSSIGYYSPEKVILPIIKGGIKVLTLNNIKKYIPPYLTKIALPLLKKIAEKLKLKAVIVLPYYINKKLEGIITFDIGYDKEIPKLNKYNKLLLNELIKIISSAILKKRIEKKLKESEKRYHQLFEFINDPIFIVSVKERGKIQEINDATIKLLGYKKHELIGKHIKQINSKKTLKIYDKLEAEFIKKKKLKFEAEHVKKTGELIPVEVNAITGNINKEPVIIAVARDLTERKKMEERLKESEEIFRTLSEQSLLGIAILQDNKFKYVNNTFSNVLGTSKEKLYKMSIKKFIKTYIVSEYVNFMLKQAYKKQQWDKSGIIQEYVYKFKTEKGYIKWGHIYSRPITFKGKPADFITVVDITDLKESEEKFKSLSEQTIIGVVINKKDKIEYFNNSFLEILGLKKEDVLNINKKGDILLKFVHPEDKNRILNEIKEKSKIKGIRKYVFRILLKDKRIKWVELYAKNINYGGGKAELLTIVDITILKETEKALRITIERLRKSNKELEQFAYVASHDLQEPLRMVSSFVKLLEKRYSEKLDKTAKEFINFAVEGAERMQKLIKGLLHYSRIETESDMFNYIDINRVIKTILEDISQLIKEKKAIIKYKRLPIILGNEIQIRQLFQNLIINALKFSKKNKPPKVYISCKNTGKYYLFSIKDNGIGVPKKYHEKIFVIFQRLHTDKNYEGTGVGLAICKKIVEKHGGEIWVESQKGKGSTFYFTILNRGGIKK